MFYLQFQQNDKLLFDYKLRARKIRIGRSDSCDIALPGDMISRLHCQLEHRNSGWIISDHSRHGTFIDGKRIDVYPLQDGDSFEMGEYQVSLRQFGENTSETTEVYSPRAHEFLQRKENALVTEAACLVLLEKEEIVKEFALRRTQYTNGGKGSDIEISKHNHLKNHAIIFVSRGRVMVAPKAGPVFLNGQRISNITPVYSGETMNLGEVALRVDAVRQKEQGIAGRFGLMETKSPTMKEKFGQLKLFAAHDFPILITGESGTGKELVATALHSASPREGGPFVPINCGAIPQNLIESELFGHVKGSFSGAIADKDGAFQQANGGTLFLDELGDLPLSAQVKLLRVLEGGDVRRVGSSKVEFPNVRIIAATNQKLMDKIEDGSFREDLFFRLQVLSIQLPPLRERLEDIALLTQSILQNLNSSCQISSDALAVLKAYSWPGNIRELRNVLCRAYVLSQGKIELEHIELHGLGSESMAQKMREKEKKQTFDLVQIYTKHNGNRSAMARELGIPRTTLIYRLQQAGLA